MTKGPPPKTHDQVVGTNSGYAWHQYRKEASCRECSTAHAAYAQQAKKNKVSREREAGRLARLNGTARPRVAGPMDGIEW